MIGIHNPFGMGRWRDSRGAVLVETALALPVILLLILGSLDIAWASYQWNAASKATQLGARWAVVNPPISTAVNTYLNDVSWWDPDQIGLPCSDANVDCTAAGTGTFACPGDGCTMDAIADEMRLVFPQLENDEIRVVYQAIDDGDGALGFVGRPGGNPMFVSVTVCRNFDFFFLEAFLGWAARAAPAGCTNAGGIPIPATYRLPTEAMANPA